MKVIRIIVLFFACHQIALSADIQKIVWLKEARHLFDALDDKALVVFDVDETLILAHDKIRRRHPETVIQEFHKKNFDQKVEDKERWYHLDSIILKMTQQKLVELESAAIIKNLQARNIRVIALTHMTAGAYYTIESMQEWRYQQLYELGIDLHIHNPENFTFTNLPMGRVSHPLFYKGVLPTSRSCTKGQALAELIKQLGYTPSKVLFFDDLMEHVDSVHQEMAAMGISCTAFHYSATEHMQEKIDTLVAEYQYRHLIRYEKWLSDQQARELIAAQLLLSML